jgi:hypothetical protein
MYDKLNEITFDGCEYYYNNGEYTVMFDGAEGGLFWVSKNNSGEICEPLPYKFVDEFIAFATYIKNLEK